MIKTDVKVSQLRDLIDRLSLDGILLTEQKNVSWFMSGRSFINQASETGVVFFLILKDKVMMIANNIEGQRILEEELRVRIDQIETFPWHAPEKREELLKAYSSKYQIATDKQLDQELLSLRTTMTPDNLKDLKELGRDVASAIEETAFNLKQGDTEFAIAGQLAAHSIKRGFEPVVTLVAADERAYTRRHPLPTQRRLNSYAMLVLCGRRHGLVMSVTRLVHFGQPSRELLERHQAVATVDARMIRHTRPGVKYEELFKQMKAAYDEVGYPDEWQQHHQGGLSGYSTRERLLLPNSRDTVQELQVYAWNPSIAGVKSEDTILVEGSTQEILTYTGEYAYIDIECMGSVLKRPSILVRSKQL